MLLYHRGVLQLTPLLSLSVLLIPTPKPLLSYPPCLVWWPLRLDQWCQWACCLPACFPIAPHWARWPGAANKLCIQTVDATNGAVQWTNQGDEQLKRCLIPLARRDKELLLSAEVKAGTEIQSVHLHLMPLLLCVYTVRAFIYIIILLYYLFIYNCNN